MSVNVVERAFAAALRKFSGSNFAELTETEQILVTIWGIEAEVNNGGFGQYFHNATGDQAFFAPHALRSIGAVRMAQIVAGANSLFSPDGPPQQWDERFKKLQQIDAAVDDPWDEWTRAFQDYPDDLNGLLEKFLTRDAGI